MVQALAGVTRQEDAGIAKYVADEVVHLRFLESTFLWFPRLLFAFKLGRAPDLFDEEFADVDRTIFATKHAVGDALAADLVAVVCRRVLGPGRVEVGARFTLVEVTHE
jgi:hypothetical protein